LVLEGKIKKQKPLPQIDVEDKPFQKPVGWSFTRLGELFLSINSGGTPSKRNSEYWEGSLPWASVKDLGTQRCIEETQDHITDEGLKNGSRLANIDDILICTRMGLGKISIVKSPMAYNQDLKAVKLTNNVSVEHFINTYATLKIKGTGTTVMGIKQEQLLEYIIGLPPFEEQHRIVAKVDELMVLCDQLEAQTESSIDAHKTLVEVLLATLTDAKNTDELNENWQTLSQHFDVLFTTQASIDQLKQTILQLAVMGKLVKQDPKDEPVSKLLERIATEKQQLIKDKKIKKQKPLPPITDEEKPFGLPVGWEWAKLGNALNKITDGTHHSPINGESGEYLYISAKNIKNNGVQLSNATYVTKEMHDEIYSRCDPEYGDILYIKDGATTGIVTINDIDEPFSMLSSVALLKCPAGILNRYLLLSLRSPFFYKEMRAGMSGVAITRVTLKKLNAACFPLPSLTEQHRIVAKVDELMALCEQLKVRLRDAQTTQLQLTEAIVEQAL